MLRFLRLGERYSTVQYRRTGFVGVAIRPSSFVCFARLLYVMSTRSNEHVVCVADGENNGSVFVGDRMKGFCNRTCMCICCPHHALLLLVLYRPFFSSHARTYTYVTSVDPIIQRFFLPFHEVESIDVSFFMFWLLTPSGSSTSTTFDSLKWGKGTGGNLDRNFRCQVCRYLYIYIYLYISIYI